MNNSQLQTNKIQTMASGLRDDAWHWRNNDVSLFSSEKLRNILRMSELRMSEAARCKEDQAALQKVRAELEKRMSDLVTARHP